MRFGRKQSEALLDPGKADLVAETADGVVELVIVADAPCTGSDGQLSSLQDKVQTYDLAGRLRVCAAPAFDRVFVDVARNAQRRFCSPQCHSRVKAAAHRARKAAS